MLARDWGQLEKTLANVRSHRRAKLSVFRRIRSGCCVSSPALSMSTDVEGSKLLDRVSWPSHCYIRLRKFDNEFKYVTTSP